jgi:hypothetical protein
MPGCPVLDCGMKSIVQDMENPRCFLCGAVRGLELHHIMHGSANRRLSTRYGLTCLLCRTHHTGKFGVHSDSAINHELQRMAQTAFEKRYSRAEWMKIFRKNYL